jgi:hypothetical protein
MRLTHAVLLLLPLLPMPVYAETAAGGDPAQSTTRHQAWERRFEQANTSRDGHLTLEQARKGYATIARHFRAIDTATKGYVTIDDVKAWHQAQRTARHHDTASDGDGLRPRAAVHHSLPGQHQYGPTAGRPAEPLPDGATRDARPPEVAVSPDGKTP